MTHALTNSETDGVGFEPTVRFHVHTLSRHQKETGRVALHAQNGPSDADAVRAEDANTRGYSPNGVPLAYHSRTISGLSGDRAPDRDGAISEPARTGVSAQETVTLASAFDNLCERCPTGWRVVGDTLCAACRAEVDALYCDLPGARA